MVEYFCKKLFNVPKIGRKTNYNKIKKDKMISVPYFPIGFAEFGDKYVVSGFKARNKIYLAVWNTGGKKPIEVPIKEEIDSVVVGYPTSVGTSYWFEKDILIVDFDQQYQARFFEITTK